MIAGLGVHSCDKCGELMEKRQRVLVVAEGFIAKSNDLLEFVGDGVRYACHLTCWDGTEQESSHNGSEEDV